MCRQLFSKMIQNDMQPFLKNKITLFCLMTWVSSVTGGIQPVHGRDLTDPLGRAVQIPASIQRIVSLAPSVTEIIYAIGRGDALVGATTYSDYPPAANHLTKIGSYVHLDLEKIVSLQPDLCIAVKDGNPIEMIRRIEAMGIPVYAVDPQGIQNVIRTIVIMGELLDANNRAQALADQMHARLQVLQTRMALANSRPGVFLQIGISPIVSVGSNTFLDELIHMAGGRNLAAGPTAYPRFSMEQVLALAPDVLIITSMARSGAFDQARQRWQQWRAMPAARQDRIHLVDSNLFDRPSPRLLDGLETLARLIHPELYEKATAIRQDAF